MATEKKILTDQDALYTLPVINELIYGAFGFNNNVQIDSDITGLVIDSNVETITLADDLEDYEFEQVGNVLKIFQADNESLLVAEIIIGDSATKLQVANGAYEVKMLAGTPATMTIGEPEGLAYVVSADAPSAYQLDIPTEVAQGETLTLTASQADGKNISGEGSVVITALEGKLDAALAGIATSTVTATGIGGTDESPITYNHNFGTAIVTILSGVVAFGSGAMTGEASFVVNSGATLETLQTLHDKLASVSVTGAGDLRVVINTANTDLSTVDISGTLTGVISDTDPIDISQNQNLSNVDVFDINQGATLTLAFAQAKAISGDGVYTLTDDGETLWNSEGSQNILVSQAKILLGASNAEDYVGWCSLNDTWENLTNPDNREVIESTQGFVISDFDGLTFENLTMYQAAVLTYSDNAYDLNNEPIDIDFSISDTFENILSWEDDFGNPVWDATSYTITDIDTINLDNISVAYAKIVAGAKNYDGSPYTIVDTMDNITDAFGETGFEGNDLTTLNGASAVKIIAAADGQMSTMTVTADDTDSGNETITINYTFLDVEGQIVINDTDLDVTNASAVATAIKDALIIVSNGNGSLNNTMVSSSDNIVTIDLGGNYTFFIDSIEIGGTTSTLAVAYNNKGFNDEDLTGITVPIVFVLESDFINQGDLTDIPSITVEGEHTLDLLEVDALSESIDISAGTTVVIHAWDAQENTLEVTGEGNLFMKYAVTDSLGTADLSNIEVATTIEQSNDVEFTGTFNTSAKVTLVGEYDFDITGATNFPTQLNLEDTNLIATVEQFSQHTIIGGTTTVAATDQSDTFVFTPDDTGVVITDFSAGGADDILDFTAFLGTFTSADSTLAGDALNLTDGGSNVGIFYSDNDGISATDIDSNTVGVGGVKVSDNGKAVVLTTSAANPDSGATYNIYYVQDTDTSGAQEWEVTLVGTVSTDAASMTEDGVYA